MAHQPMLKMRFSHPRACGILAAMTMTTRNGSPRTFVPRTPGVEICVLRLHADRGLTFLVRMARGARAERHNHPGGEETYVLLGKVRIDRRIAADGRALPDVVLVPGSHLFAEPGEVHEGEAEEDTEFLVFAPVGIAKTPAMSG